MYDNLNDEWWWFLAMKVKLKRMWLAFTFWITIYFPADGCYNYSTLSDADRKNTYDTPPNSEGVCDSSLPEGWYRFKGDAGKKYQQRQWMVITVIQPTQASWEVMNLQWEMVKYLGRSVSPEVVTLARIQLQSQWKTVDPTLSTNWFHLRLVVIATVAQTKHEADEWEKSCKWKTQWVWFVVFNSSKI